jgi:hypothetical protein
VVNRAEAHVLRLAMLVALANESSLIERPHLEAALAIVAYSERSATYFLAGKLADPVAEKILHALREVFPAGLTRTELHAVLQRHVPISRIKEALAALIKDGLAREEREPSSGGARPWRYHSLAK